jgi:hypothetical protein
LTLIGDIACDEDGVWRLSCGAPLDIFQKVAEQLALAVVILPDMKV